VSAASGAVQASVVRAEIDSIRPPSSSTRTCNEGLQSRSRRTGRENFPFAQKLLACAPSPSCATRASIEVPQVQKKKQKEAEGQADKASSLDSAVHFK